MRATSWAKPNAADGRRLAGLPKPQPQEPGALGAGHAGRTDGPGIGLQPTYLAGPLLASGALVRVLPDWEPEQLGIHAVYTSRRHQPLLLRTFVDFLAQRFDSQQPYWDGPQPPAH